MKEKRAVAAARSRLWRLGWGLPRTAPGAASGFRVRGGRARYTNCRPVLS